MKIFHSDLTTPVVLGYKQLHPDKPFHALISYGRLGQHHSNLMLSYRNLIDTLILDSGTFTLNNNKKKYRNSITCNGYKSYLNVFANKVDFYFNFDEDFSQNGFETNYRNQLDLESAGLKPVPVIHDCYGPEIDIYIDRGYQLVAIGSGELQFASQYELFRIVDSFYKKGVKVHFLGCTQFDKLAYIPAYSADSTTWNRTGTSGRILWWNPDRIGYKKIDEIAIDEKAPKSLADYHIRDYPFLPQLEEYLDSELGLSVADLQGGKRFLNRCLVNVHFFVLLEELINQEHKKQGFIFD